MTEPKISVTEDELHAYVDNELPAERRDDVEMWLATHPEDDERVRSWRAMARITWVFRPAGSTCSTETLWADSFILSSGGKPSRLPAILRPSAPNRPAY